MNVLILGAGKVGATIAEQLAQDPEFDITLVDTDQEALEVAKSTLDNVTTVVGHAAHQSILRQANIEDADLILAVTGRDEVNMVACQVAYSLFSSPKRIARIRADEYTLDEELFKAEHLPVDLIINPQKLVTQEIKRLIDHPGTTRVLDVAQGTVSVAALKPSRDMRLRQAGAAITNRELEEDSAKFVAYIQGNTVREVTANTHLADADEVIMIAPTKKLDHVIQKYVQKADRYERVMIAGGGNIGLRLSQELQDVDNVKRVNLIEANRARVEVLKDVLSQDTNLLHGNATDAKFLTRNQIDDTNLFCAVTNSDEVNIMSSLLAQSLSDHHDVHTISLIGNTSYVRLIDELTNIDVAVSPQYVTASAILKFVSEGQPEVHKLKAGDSELLETHVSKETKNQRLIGSAIDRLPIPKNAFLCGVVRNERLHVALSDLAVQPEDRFIFCLTDAKARKAIEKVFRPSPFIYF